METIRYQTETKAKRDHLCDFCGQKIRQGEKYMKSTHKQDGDIYDWKTHDWCQKLSHQMEMYDDAPDGVSQDMFVEYVSDAHDDILINQLPNSETGQFSDVIKQLKCVNWRDKLSYVIRHFNKLESTT